MRLQKAKQSVEHHDRASIANMRQVVDCGATDVQGNGVGHEGLEYFLLRSHGVVKRERHLLALTECSKYHADLWSG